MFYREAGQFKTSYFADLAAFPIRQDRIGMFATLYYAVATAKWCKRKNRLPSLPPKKSRPMTRPGMRRRRTLKTMATVRSSSRCPACRMTLERKTKTTARKPNRPVRDSSTDLEAPVEAARLSNGGALGCPRGPFGRREVRSALFLRA